MLQETHYQIQGMSQDMAYQLFNPKYAFECKNIRINTTDENSLLGLSNERGNSKIAEITVEGGNTPINIIGIGQFSEYCVLFGKATGSTSSPDGEDYIFIMDSEEQISKIYQGDLEFDLDYPIRTICVYENERVQKVYWIDGKNVPRVLNIAGHLTENNTIRKVEEQKINFLPKLKFGETVTVKKTSGGQLPAGIIQYAFTYSDKNLQETNIWYTTPLYYITQANKGEEAGTICNVAFDIEFSNLDTDFDYLQIYALVRTSLNAEPACYRIANIPTSVNKFTDSGTQWEAYPLTSILGKQLGTFVPKVLTSKDSTLFLGNYTIKSPQVKREDYEDFLGIMADLTTIEYRDSLNAEVQESSFNSSRSVQTFRSGEYYRLGIQFQDDYGTPSSVIYLKDIQAGIADPVSRKFMQKIVSSSIPDLQFLSSSQEYDNIEDAETQLEDIKSKFKRARLLMVNRETLPHRTLCQGVLCPTVYRIYDRVANTPFAMSSWNMRCMDNDEYNNATWCPDTQLRGAQWAEGGEVQSQGSKLSVFIVPEGGAIGNPGDLQVKDSFGTVTSDTTPSILINTNDTQGSQSSPTYYYYMVMSVLRQPTDYDKRYYNLSVIIKRTTDGTVESFDEPPIGGWTTLVNRRTPIYSVDAAHPDIYTNAGLLSWFTNQILLALTRDGATNPESITANAMQSWNLPSGSDDLLDYITANGPGNYWILYSDREGGKKPVKVADTRVQSFKDALDIAKVRGQAFFCDHNILTFHSPDIERYQSIIDNNPSIKYRIVGYTNFETSYFDSFLQTSPPNAKADGQQNVKTVSDSGIYNAYLWKDTKTYPVYTWHRSMTLGGQADATQDGKWYGSYTKKRMANVHKCGDSFGFHIRKYNNPELSNESYSDSNSHWEIDSIYPTDNVGTANPRFPKMGTPRVFNSNEIQALVLDGQKDSRNIESSLIYWGNVNIAHTDGTYGIRERATDSGGNEYNALPLNPTEVTDPCIIRYKSTPHVVMPMSYFASPSVVGKVYAPSLPYPGAGVPSNDNVTNYGYIWANTTHGFERSEFMSTSAETLPIDYGAINTRNLIYIVELYQDLSVENIYGNTDEENLSKYNWIPISDWVDLEEGEVIEGFGDCFIGKWDCLKTYAYTEDDLQSYIDITTFTVESDTNLEARCDLYRKSKNTSVVTASKFNIFNPVYDQKDNLFSYRTITEDNAIDNFQNQICWSDVKTLGEELDTWCQINVGNNSDLQGEYGELKALVKNNNSIFCFQDNAIYKLNYNTRVTISPSDGIPIQLTNNYRVEPPLLLKTNCGVLSQDSVTEASKNLYILDSIRRRAFIIDERDNIIDVSTAKGVNSTISKLGTFKKVLFDPNINDVYFNFESASLGFNEDIGEFTSLYDYDKSNFIFSLGRNSYSIFNNKIYRQRTGKYNNFFDEYKPYYIELLSSDQPLKSKTFTNVEFTMASPTFEEAFNKVEAKTSYQEGESDLTFEKNRPSSLKRKFRLWRVNLPRHESSLDRMRDTWCKIKLIKVPIIGGNMNEQAIDDKNNIATRVNHINVIYLPD